jgi:hypothetical protein
MLDERGLGFLAQTMPAPNTEMLTVTVIPCGREDGKNSEEEMPYEIKIRKKRKFRCPLFSFQPTRIVSRRSSFASLPIGRRFSNLT